MSIAKEFSKVIGRVRFVQAQASRFELLCALSTECVAYFTLDVKRLPKFEAQIFIDFLRSGFYYMSVSAVFGVYFETFVQMYEIIIQ